MRQVPTEPEAEGRTHAALERFERFPATDDQIAMLLNESVCDHRPFYDAFGFEPLSLPDFLAKRPRPPKRDANPPAVVPPPVRKAA